MYVEYGPRNKKSRESIADWVEYCLAHGRRSDANKTAELIAVLTADYLARNPSRVQDVVSIIGCYHKNHRIVDEVE